MKNLGLEALAALASSVSAANGSTSENEYNSNNRPTTTVPDSLVPSLTPLTSSSAPSSNNSHSEQVNHNVRNSSIGSSSSDQLTQVIQNAAASLLQQSTVNGITPQHLQQILSAATASAGFAGSIPNQNQVLKPASQSQPSNIGLSLSTLLSTIPNVNQIDPWALQAVQQQFSIYQHLMQQHQVQNSQQNQTTNFNSSSGQSIPNAAVDCGTVSSSARADHVANDTTRSMQMPYGPSVSTNPIGLLAGT